MSQTNNKSSYGVFSSMKADVERRIEKIENNVQPMIITGIAICGMAFCTMDVKGEEKELV